MARLALLTCRLKHSAGSNWPGDVALSYCPDILTHLSRGADCLLVTGTNGKTTTAAMIRQIFTSKNIPVIANKEGSNMQSGMIVPFLRHRSLRGSFFRKFAVLECDELWVPLAFREVRPKYLVITNLSEDQEDRTGSPEELYQLLLSSVRKSDAVLCINENCPVSGRMLKEGLPNRIISFSAKGTDVIVNGKRYPVDLSIPGDYNVENAAAAAAACLLFGISPQEALSALKDFRAPFGRMETFSMDGVPVTICLAKNVVSADNVLSCIASREPDARVVFGFHTNIGDSADRTWIGKIGIRSGMDFLEGAVASGSCMEEIAEALSVHGYSCRKAKTPEEVIPIIRESSRPVYILASYTYMMEIRKLFVNAGYLKDFWKT